MQTWVTIKLQLIYWFIKCSWYFNSMLLPQWIIGFFLFKEWCSEIVIFTIYCQCICYSDDEIWSSLSGSMKIPCLVIFSTWKCVNLVQWITQSFIYRAIAIQMFETETEFELAYMKHWQMLSLWELPNTFFKRFSSQSVIVVVKLLWYTRMEIKYSEPF